MPALLLGLPVGGCQAGLPPTSERGVPRQAGPAVSLASEATGGSPLKAAGGVCRGTDQVASGPARR